MSRPDLPFESLTSPRVAPAKPTPPTPVNWFTHIAPRLAEPERRDAAQDETAAPGKPRRAAFLDVDAIAADERRQRQVSTPEPAEITMLRLQASEEARQLVEQALMQAQSIAQEARDQGYRAGYDRGSQEGHDEATRLALEREQETRAAYHDDLTLFVNHIEAERLRAWAELEPQIIGLVFDLTRQVIKQEVEASRTVVLAMIRNVLRRAADAGMLRVRVNTADLETVRTNRAELLGLLDGVPHLDIIEDRRVGPGGCIVDTDAGSIDARIETQVAEVADTLEQLVAHRAVQTAAPELPEPSEGAA